MDAFEHLEEAQSLSEKATVSLEESKKRVTDQ